MLKKMLLAISVLGIIMSSSCVLPAQAATIPASEVADASPLYGTYPCVGGNDASMFYLDPSSCYATTDGSVATLSAMFYGTGGGAAPDGGPAKLTPYVATFETYKKNGKRQIFLKSIVTAKGRDVTNSVLRDDAGFLNGLFWTIADYSGMRQSLD